MPEWKKQIFVKAVDIRIKSSEGSVEEIINSYPKLTDIDKEEILDFFKR